MRWRLYSENVAGQSSPIPISTSNWMQRIGLWGYYAKITRKVDLPRVAPRSL